MKDRVVNIKSYNICRLVMSNELDFKYEVEIKSAEKKQLLSKETKE